MARSFQHAVTGETPDQDEAAFERGARRRTLVLAALVVGVLLLATAGRFREPARGSGAHAGESAPAFDLPALEGGRVRLAAYAGHPIVLHFWASWCAPCRTEAPLFARVAGASGPDVVFIGINTRDREEDALAFLDEYGAGFPNARDAAGATESRYAGVGLPATVFIAADGTIARTWIGTLDERQLLGLVAEIRTGAAGDAALQTARTVR